MLYEVITIQTDGVDKLFMSDGTAVGRFHDTRTAAGDDVESAFGELAAEFHGFLIIGVILFGSGAPKDRY